MKLKLEEIPNKQYPVLFKVNNCFDIIKNLEKLRETVLQRLCILAVFMIIVIILESLYSSPFLLS